MTESQYLEIAIEGMKEELEKFNNQLLILEKEPENQDVINEIFKYEMFRMAHFLKGIAGIILTLIPFVFFELIAFLLLCAVAYEVSMSIFLTCFIKKNTLSLKSVLNHFLNYILIALALVLVSVLFKIYLLPFLYHIFGL